MQQIADASGVSRMTVSLALRNSPEVSVAVRSKIRELAKSMGYRPNPLVSALMAQRSSRKTEGAVYPMALLNSFGDEHVFRKSEFYGAMLAGISRRCDELGFRAEVFSLQGPNQIPVDRLHRILRTQAIRGVIVLPVGSQLPKLNFPWEHYSAATLGHTLHEPALNRAATDQYLNAWTALEAVARLGYRRPGILLPEDTNVRTNYHYVAAYLAFQRYQIVGKPIPPCHGDFATGGKQIQAWLHRHRPDVLLGLDDLRPELAELGWRVPEDSGFVSLSLLDSQKGLSGIDPLVSLVGQAAVDLVVALLHRNEAGPPRNPRTTLVAGRWREGLTTKMGDK